MENFTPGPKGYTVLNYYLHGSNVSYIAVYVCDRCGSMVGNYIVHNHFHNDVQMKQATLRVTNNPGTEDEKVVIPPENINTNAADIVSQMKRIIMLEQELEDYDELATRTKLDKEWRESGTRADLVKRLQKAKNYANQNV